MLGDLRDHMLSQHQTEDHDIDECDDCVVYLKKKRRPSQALMAALRRRAGKEGIDATAANMQDVDSHEKRAKDEEENSIDCKEIIIEMAKGLNDELMNVHMDMQLIPSL